MPPKAAARAARVRGSQDEGAAATAALAGTATRDDIAARVALAAALLALGARFVLAGDASLTSNEATYIELAGHPSWSSYYPDTVFVRHPPNAFLLLADWTAVAGPAERVVRLLGLAATIGAVLLVSDAARGLLPM